MAGGKFTLYNSAHLNFWNGTFAFGSDTITCVLLGSGYTPSVSHSTYGDISSNEISDADYSAQSVTGSAVTASGSTVELDCDAISFGSDVTIAATYAVLVQQSGGSLAAGDQLIGYASLKSDSSSVNSTSSTFSVTPSASGLLTSEPV